MIRFPKISLALRISFAIVLVQIGLTTAVGVFYVDRFTSGIDRRVLTQIKAPASLMNEGTLAFGAISNRQVIEQVVGTPVLDALIIGPDHTVYYSLEPGDVGQNAQRLARLDKEYLNGPFGDAAYGQNASGDYVSVEPVFAAASQAPFLSVYLKASGADVQREKGVIIWLFILSSLLTALAISTLLILSLQYLVFHGLRRLTDAARAIGPGRIDEVTLARLPRAGDDDLGQLSRAFQEMVIEVSKARADLVDYSHRLVVDVARRTADLNSEKARAETVLASIGEGLCVVSFDSSVLMVNPSLRRLFALGEGAYVGRPYLQVLPAFLTAAGESLSPEHHPVAAAMALGAETQGFYAVRLGERLLRLSCHVTPVKSGTGLLGLVAVFRDVSAEYELDRAKSDFIDVAVHQLKTPLTALRWSVESLMESRGDQKFSAGESEIINDINAVTQRLSGLVASLLNISRLDGGRLKFEPRSTDFSALLKDVIADQSAAAAARHQEVAFEQVGSVPTVSVDPRYLREAVTNLLTNAIKYSPEGGRIEVTLAEQGAELVIAVKDNGIGIPADERQRLTNKFFRASNAVGSHEDGDGLGLYFVKQVTEASGGRFWFDSEENNGSTFYIALAVDARRR